MAPCDVESPADEAVRLAGIFNRLGDRVPRGFLHAIGNSREAIPAGVSGRLQLAHWLTDESGAGPLAARVLANRLWHHLLGRGLVRSVDNFGRTGEAASHPELLDYLARRLVDSGWSVKRLVREIVLSRAFALSSQASDVGDTIDPENRLLWRAHRRRLEPEALRDAMLTAAGQLELAPQESTVSYLGDQATAVGDNQNRRRTDFPCRSVYLPVIRNDLPELFQVFDFADAHACTGMRPQTMVATQGLFLLNDRSVMAAADATARCLLAETSSSEEARLVQTMFELLLNTAPTDEERTEFLAFMHQVKDRLRAGGGQDVDLQAWSLACQALFASSRFQFLD
jgi:hypothetical protein